MTRAHQSSPILKKSGKPFKEHFKKIFFLGYCTVLDGSLWCCWEKALPDMLSHLKSLHYCYWVIIQWMCTTFKTVLYKVTIHCALGSSIKVYPIVWPTDTDILLVVSTPYSCTLNWCHTVLRHTSVPWIDAAPNNVT